MSGKNDDFASMMEQMLGEQNVRASRRLKAGQMVEGVVVQIGADSVFVDVGATVEGRIERAELEDKQGQLSVRVGDRISASVVQNDDVHGPRLTTALGRGSTRTAIDVDTLQRAKEAQLPVEGVVQKSVKGGLEVQVAGVRAFCPASQVDTGYVSDLESYVGQSLQFRVLEVRENGRSVVVSRKALLEQERERHAQELLSRLRVGGDYEGTVQSLQKYGAFIDLGAGVEGLVHVSELGHARVERVEDVLSVGETVTVRVLAIEPGEKGRLPKLRLSLKALSDPGPSPQPGEVLEGKVSQLSQFGVFVETARGSGLVPSRELGLPRGADHRRLLPVGTPVKVVLVNRDEKGRVTFSMSRVAGVEERRNYADFTQSKRAASEGGALGSLGDVLRQKIHIETSQPADEPPPASAGTIRRRR